MLKLSQDTYFSVALGGDLRFKEQLIDEAKEHEHVEAKMREDSSEQRALLEVSRERVV